MSEKYDWVNVMEDMPGGDMVYKSEADSVVADLTARLERAEGVVEWQSIETAPKGDTVEVFYRNSNGMARTSRAAYFRPTLHWDSEPCEDCIPNGKLDENGECDEWLAPLGWYEIPGWQEDEPKYWLISETITHWRPVPETKPYPDGRPDKAALSPNNA